MKLSIAKKILFSAAIIQLVTLTPQANAQLKAGAARIDITPALADLPKPFTSIYSNIYARSLVLESGGTRVALVVCDLPTTDPGVFEDLTNRIAAAAGTPVENVFMAITHTHNGVRLANDGMGILLPGSTKITRMTGEQIIESVKQAVANLRPARAGYATGIFHLAAARQTGPQQPGVWADQAQSSANVGALGVFKVESETGETIALLVNGGPEPVMMYSAAPTKISADVAGVMERYVEQRFSDKAVVLYTVGSPPGMVINARQRIPGATPADPTVLMSAVGTVLGEDVLTTSLRIKTSSDLPLFGASQVLTCPGKATTPLNNAASCSDAPDSKLPRCVFTDHDTDPVNLRIGMIRLGDLSVVYADANINNAVWAEVRDKTAVPANTMLVALTYGPMHYVMPDSEYPSNSYQVTASMAKRGCAEKGFVDGALTMLKAGANGAK